MSTHTPESQPQAGTTPHSGQLPEGLRELPVVESTVPLGQAKLETPSDASALVELDPATTNEQTESATETELATQPVPTEAIQTATTPNTVRKPWSKGARIGVGLAGGVLALGAITGVAVGAASGNHKPGTTPTSGPVPTETSAPVENLTEQQADLIFENCQSVFTVYPDALEIINTQMTPEDAALVYKAAERADETGCNIIISVIDGYVIG